MDRRRMPGIEPGRTGTARGRVAERDGRRVLYKAYHEPPSTADGGSAGWDRERRVVSEAVTEHDPGGSRQTDRAAQQERPGAPTLLEQMGGVWGLVYTSIPVLVFVVVNAATALMPAIYSALGSAVAIAAVRVIRRERLQPAVSGLFGVAIAAFIAYRTGSAKGFFAFGIVLDLLYGGVFLASIAARWPLAGVLWSALNGHGMAWRRDKKARRHYDVATSAWVVIFAARFVVKGWLYTENAVGWLAFAKIAMGWPLAVLAALVTVWAVRKADRRTKNLREPAEERSEQNDGGEGEPPSRLPPLTGKHRR
jgi:hypothetical protein